MDKNIFLAIALSILVYVGWFSLMNRLNGPQHRPAPAAPAGASRAGAQGAPEAPAERAAPEAERSRPGEQSPTAEAARAPKERARDIAYKVGRIELKVQPFGAGIVSYLYPGPLGPVELVMEPRSGFFSTWPQLEFRAGQRPLVFEAVHPSGVRISKEFLISEEKGLHTMRLTFSNPTGRAADIPAWDVSIGPGLGTVANELKENPSQWRAAALRPPAEGQTQPRLEAFKLKQEPSWREEPYLWIGVDNRYFLAAALPSKAQFPRFYAGAEKIGPEGQLAPVARFESKPLRVEPGRPATLEIPFYMGPKGYTHLSALGLNLEKSVQFGWFDKIGRMALQCLYVLHRFTGNYGWSIIIMTILLQVILFPLTYKQMKSAAIMKKLQPELSRIQQKFAKDPQRLNQEMLELYRRHGANPLGGCLPLIVQMPVFIALFNALRNAWELHGAPWIFWLKDLSAHDPYYILPLIMGAVMFLQSKMNPVQAADPAQAKIFQYMPVIFTFMFLKFPAGLVLYWLTNSVLGFLQQLALRKRWE